MFHQRLAEALGDSAYDLALQDERIDDRAHVVFRGVAEYGHAARIGIDFHFADVATVGKIASLGLEADAGCQTRRDAPGQRLVRIGSLYHGG